MFTLHILENAYPRIDQPSYPHDLTVRQSSWFEHTLWIGILDDKEVNRQYTFEMVTNDTWVEFNSDNRTFHAYVDPDSVRLGTHRVTVSFVDDQGLAAFLNVKIEVLPALEPKDYTLLILGIVSCFLSTMTLLMYAWNVNLDLKVEATEEEVDQAKARFHGFLDVNIRLQNTKDLAYNITKQLDRVQYIRS
jgi:hypothetical protein